MERVLLVSLISDQTLPNVQIIKEYQSISTDYLFITTKSMENKGVRKWIEASSNIDASSNIIIKEVEEYNQEDIISKLNELDFSIYHRILFNITGGTKIMTLASYDYFKEKHADIYYVKGKSQEYLKLGPVYETKLLHNPVSLGEYLKAYGFDSEEGTLCHMLDTEFMLNKYCEGIFDQYPNELDFLREKRNKGVKPKDYENVKALLDALEIEKPDMCLSPSEVKFLTGEWFEEYIGKRVKTDLGLDEANIKIGIKIAKDVSGRKDLNSIPLLLGVEDVDYPTDNEIDVMFMYNGTFHVIECKTSIIDKRKEFVVEKTKSGKTILDENGNPKRKETWKRDNILDKTIYKSDALKNKFGLFAKSYIITLTDFKEMVRGDNNRTKRMQDLLNRASVSQIKIIGREQLLQAKSIKDLL